MEIALNLLKTRKIHLFPNVIGNEYSFQILSLLTKEIIKKTNYYIIENENAARSFIKKIYSKKIKTN